jgi:polyhydroxyalkanoate synthase
MFCYYLRNMYLENRLREPGALTTAGFAVDLGAIKAPVFIYCSREDHIVPSSAAFKAIGLLNPGNAGNNRFVMGASGHIAGVINPASKGKRSYWTNDGAGGKSAKAAPPADFDAWHSGATEHKGSWWGEWSAFLAGHGGKEVKPRSKLGNKQYTPIEAAPGRYVKVRAD